MVAFLDSGERELSQWHFLRVVSYFLHLPVHHIHVKNESQQVFDRSGQLAILRVFLHLLFLPFLISLNFSLPLIIQHYLYLGIAPVYLGCQFGVVQSHHILHVALCHTLLSWHSHSAPTGEEVGNVWGGITLEHLQYVELVVVMPDVALV